MASTTRSRGARSADGRRHVLDSAVEIRDMELAGERERLSWLAKGVEEGCGFVFQLGNPPGYCLVLAYALPLFQIWQNLLL